MACQIEAKVLRRSVGRDAPPITTFQLRYPLQIHAELMTHRVFSRNARSSRAVPTERLLAEVREAPFIPRYWGKNQKGMQAGAEHDAPVYIPFVETDLDDQWNEMSNVEAWLSARDAAVVHAKAYADAGYHKQIANRLLAPFLHIDVVLTTTELENWNALRDDDMAEPHIRDLARAMKEAVAAYGEPLDLEEGQWHLPYLTPVEQVAVGPIGFVADGGERKTRFIRKDDVVIDMETARAVSVTRCAQVSYTPFHEAKLTIAEEVARHDALIAARPCHASPLEHQAHPDTRLSDGNWANPHLHGNLTGWCQYRKMVPGERA